MQIRKLKPTSPGQRHQIILSKNLLSKNNSIFKNLINHFHQKKGRSTNTGHITVRHLGGGCKKVYRKINFGNFWSKSVVVANFYDPYRTSFISLVFDLIEKKFDFLIMTEYIFPGTILSSDFEYNFFDFKLGFRTWVKNIAAGAFIHNLSLTSNSKSNYIRSAGVKGQIIQKTSNGFKIRLPSGIILTTSNLAVATIGINSNAKHKLVVLGKAGKNRLKGRRPSVRGIAMNPIDHPHGGNSNGGRVGSSSPWGKSIRGKPTSKKK